MTAMLGGLGLYSIMQVTKRRFWPRGMPRTDIVQQVESALGSHYTMKKDLDHCKIFTCAHRDKKIKAFISSCSTTRIILEQASTVQRLEVVHEYETHKSKLKSTRILHCTCKLIFIPTPGSVDAANNLRDNLPSYHDIISTERWEMRFFWFILSICEANAFSAYRSFHPNGKIDHSVFRDSLAWSLLNYCEALDTTTTSILAFGPSITLRGDRLHAHTTIKHPNADKRTRRVCFGCSARSVRGNRVEKSCNCRPDTPLCKQCHQDHLRELWSQETFLNNSV